MTQYIQSDERKKHTTKIIRLFYPTRLSLKIEDKRFYRQEIV